jgi:uncharacterized protein YndB with AHSA1/START domain
MSGICEEQNVRIVAIAASMALIFSTSAKAEVVSVAANGFQVKQTAHIAANPDKVYAALVKPSQWWSSEHTFSGNAANLSLVPKAGGCWCEKLPKGGSVLHLTVVTAKPGDSLRLRGALGPLQGMGVDGAMTWSLKVASDGTDLIMIYVVGGYYDKGFDDLSKGVDQVLGEQVGRLKSAIETGKPDAATPTPH